MRSISISILDPFCTQNSQLGIQESSIPLRNDEENSNMVESIWCRLTEDLIVIVLSHLPIPAIFATTLLSKSLNSIFKTNYFLKLHSEIRHNSQPPWFLIFPNKGFSDLCIAYDPGLNRWFDLSSRLLLPSSLFRPIAAGDGLIGLLYKNPSGVHLYISNPITNSHNKIPIPSSLHRYFLIVSGLISDRITGSFRMVLVGSEQNLDWFVLSAEVFDSDIGSWVKTRSFPVNSPASSCRAISNGVLYCVLYKSTRPIVALDTKLMVWWMLGMPLPSSLTKIKLVDRNGRLVLIGGVGCEGITEEIGIWQLDKSGRDWEVIGWLGKEFCDVFLASKKRLFGCIGCGDMLYFTSKRCKNAAVYDISRKFVRFMEPPPRGLDPHDHISVGFCFRPQL